jgi:hypothetical protein
MGTVRIGGIVKASPSTQFWLEADWVASNSSANTSTLGVWLRAANGPSGSTASNFGGYGRQEGHANGYLFEHNGNPFLPSGVPQNGQRWHDYAERTFTHDGNGNLYDVGLAMRLVYGSIDEFHYGSITAPGRIPRAPGAPGTPSVSNILPTTATVAWSGAYRGHADIDQYLVRVHTNPNPDAAGYVDFAGGGGTFSRSLTGLVPGTRYYTKVYARNSDGYGPGSAVTTFQTLAGGRAWDGSAWRNCRVRYWNGSAWQLVRVRSWDGSQWRTTR